jgi:hypothetical protein
MSINRNNYEEYFLLYNDNELTAEEMRRVEEFVAGNIDLKEEFELLKELKLDPTDEIRFDKSSLYKPITLQDDILQPTMEQEKLLMYLDDELNGKEKAALETELRANVMLNREFELLAKTKMVPDLTVVHPDKQSLYKEEKQPSRVISMIWIRVAVAAALILVMGLIWLNKPAAPATIDPVIAETEVPVIKPIEGQAVNAEESTGKSNEGNKVSRDLAANNNAVNDDGEIVNVNTGSAKKELNKSQNKLSKENANHVLEAPKYKDPDQNTMAVVKQPVFDTDPNSLATQSESRKVISEMPQAVQKVTEIVDMPSISTVKSDYATEALLNDHSNEEQEIIAQDNSSRKGAFRGLLRKANRFVSKVTNPDTNGPSVKVASFEIALAK